MCSPPGPLPALPNRPAGAPGGAEDLLARLLVRCRFPGPEEPLVAAVSGGADSLALLLLARATGRDVLAVHVDHGLRAGSAAEAHLVADVARKVGARFSSRAVVVPAGPDLEARARQARYQALPVGVMTGHTKDDRVETVLLNLLRGAALDGLSGMQDTPRVHRPLLDIRRAETEELCRLAGLTPVVDPSNQDLRFRRNRVRHLLLPLLAQVGERDPVPILARQADLLAEDAWLLEQLAAGLDPTDAGALTSAPLALARRALRRWLRHGDEQHPPSAAEITRVLAVAQGEAVACELADGRRVSRSRGRLRVTRPGSVGPDMDPSPS